MDQPGKQPGESDDIVKRDVSTSFCYEVSRVALKILGTATDQELR
jgi:hypothetical protein